MLEKLITSARIAIATWAVAWVGKTFRFPIENWMIWLMGGIGCAAVVWVWLCVPEGGEPQTTEDIVSEIFDRNGVKVKVGEVDMKPIILFSHREELG